MARVLWCARKKWLALGIWHALSEWLAIVSWYAHAKWLAPQQWCPPCIWLTSAAPARQTVPAPAVHRTGIRQAAERDSARVQAALESARRQEVPPAWRAPQSARRRAPEGLAAG